MNIMKKVFGVSLVLLGLSGIVLPILPGWVFVFSGLYLICPRKYKQIKERLVKLFRVKERAS